MKKNSYDVITSLQKAVTCLFDVKILIRLLLPLILVCTLGLFLAISFWEYGVFYSQEILKSLGWISMLLFKLEQVLNLSLFTLLSVILFIFVIFIIFYFAIFLLISVLLIPLVIPVIEKKYFPHLTELRKSNQPKIGFLKTLTCPIKYLLYYLIILIISAPLLIIPGAQVFISYLLNSYLVKSLFPLDCLSNYLTESEFKHFLKVNKASLWQLALLTNGVIYIPFINLLAPLIMALAFPIYCLGNIETK